MIYHKIVNEGSSAKLSPLFIDHQDYGENNNNEYTPYHNNDGNAMSKLVWIICGLMILNIICLTIYCMDNNNRCKFNKKQRGHEVVKYESEDVQFI